MLLIRRRRGESILVGDGIEIEVVDVSGGRVKIGIKAPAEVTILRKEVKLVANQNAAAARGLAKGLAAIARRGQTGR